MGRFLLKRIGGSFVLLIGTTIVVFLLLHIVPGDPAEVMLGETATPAAVAQLRHALKLDRPLPEQYANYMMQLAHGDLGTSIRAGEPVVTVIAARLPATVELASAATLVAVATGIPVGVLSAVRRGSFTDTAAFVASLVGQAMPGYWLGLILISIFSVWLGWLPVSGSGSVSHLVLPAVTLAAFMLGLIVRLTRSTTLEVLQEDYVRTARAKGLAESVIMRRHVLRLVLIPVITVVGIQVGTILGGAVVTETLFAWPGIGSLTVLAVTQRDYPVVQALVLISAVGFVLINLCVDVLYGYLDPRISYG